MLTNIKIGNGALGNAEFMDDDSFRLRVEKVFGSLASSSSSSLQSPLCSVTDNEVERKEWKRSLETAGRDETPCSTLSFDEYLEEEYPGLSRRSNFGNDDELDGQDDRDRWSIGSSIGLDPTLDYEEEEDEYEYDKVACGRENAGDHLYTGDVSEDGSFLNSHNVLPNSLHAPVKDPRANLLSAQVRLKEDETEAPKSNSVLASAAEIKEPQIKASQDDTYPKSILKKRSNEASSKTQKRVRFSLGCKTDSGGAPNALYYGSQGGSGVPDFLVNPSKFSRYNSDSSEDEDDTIEQQACGNFVSQAKSFDGKSVAEWENGSADLPKSYTFVSKKKSSDSKAVNDGNEVKQNKEVDSMQSVFPVGITAGEVDDQTETNTVDGFPEPCRGYQTMLRSDSSDSSGGSDS